MGQDTWFERHSKSMVFYCFCCIGIFVSGYVVWVVFTGLLPGGECRSSLYDEGKVVLEEYGVSGECPGFVVKRSCNNLWLRRFERMVEADEGYRPFYEDFKREFPDPEVLTVYYSVGDSSSGHLDVFYGEHFPRVVPSGFCEPAPHVSLNNSAFR